MSGITLFFLFLFGIAIGSFLNVVSLRYVEGEMLFKRTGGRSHCMHCGTTLRWYELIPLISFLLQRGKCRSCREKLTWQYPVVELLSGLIFVLVPYFLMARFSLVHSTYILAILWVLALMTLLTMSLIDLRLQIIPDGLTLFLCGVGVCSVLYYHFCTQFGEPFGRSAVVGTSLGSYASVFSLSSNPFFTTLYGVLFGLLFLGGLYVMTRGRGIGFGDVKLAGALGLLMGWPDIACVLMLAFIFGAGVSIPLMLFRKKGIKDAVPFGPFIALAVVVVFFFGYHIINAYFTLFKLV
ncbi:MAG: prepilin peptidase [bacterium]